MAAALIIGNVCLILLLKGVPQWLSVVLSFGYSVSNVVAILVWVDTKDRIKALENKVKKKGGAE